MNQVSMQDIAHKAGVTRATVSLALRNHPRLSAATKQRIQQVARDLAYRPDAAVATVMTRVRARQRTKSTATLAFLTAFPTRDGWRRAAAIYGECFGGARERAQELGFRLDEIWAKEPGMTGRRLTGVLLARGIDGVLVASLARSRGHLSLDWSQFAAVTFGPSLWRPNLHRVSTDHYSNFVMVARELTRRRYRRIGLVSERSSEERINYARIAALVRGLQARPRQDPVPPLLYPPMGLAEAEGKTWFQRYRPDVVVSSPGFLAWLRKWGVEVPRDTGFFCLGWQAGTPYAGLDESGRLIGMAAVELVARQLHHNERGVPAHACVLVVPGTWRDGDTLRPAT